MRQVRSIAFGLAILAGAAPMAGAQATQQQAPRAERHERGAGRFEGGLGRALFQDIKLTDAEKANVKAVRAKYQPQFKALRESIAPALKEAREARQRGDTAAAKAAFEKTKDQREQARKLLEQARTELRTALTPEHQQQFDANVARIRQQVAEHRGRGPGAWNGKHDKGGR